MRPSHLAARTALALLAFSLATAPAHAQQGLNLAWLRCYGEGLGAQNLAFACNTNLGSRVLVGSFKLSTDMAKVIGTEITLQLASAGPTLPAWWQFFSTGACRQNSMFVNFNANAADVVCLDYLDGQSIGGIGAYCTVAFPCVGGAPPSANSAVIKAIHAVQATSAMDVLAGVENFDFNLVINNGRTVGTGSCGGCSTPVCIVLNSINVVAQDNVEHRFLSTPTVPGSNAVTWQGGGGVVVGPNVGCPAATATQRSTWGSVKSLYR